MDLLLELDKAVKRGPQPGQLGLSFDESEHPREPAGSAKGGEFKKKEGGDPNVLHTFTDADGVKAVVARNTGKGGAFIVSYHDSDNDDGTAGKSLGSYTWATEETAIKDAKRFVGYREPGLPQPRDMTTLSAAELKTIYRDANAWQYLRMKHDAGYPWADSAEHVEYGKRNSKSHLDQWLMDRHNITDATAHRVANDLDAGKTWAVVGGYGLKNPVAWQGGDPVPTYEEFPDAVPERIGATDWAKAPDTSANVLHTFTNEEDGVKSVVARNTGAGGGFIVSLHDLDAGESVGISKIHTTEEAAIKDAKELVHLPEDTEEGGGGSSDDNSASGRSKTALPEHLFDDTYTGPRFTYGGDYRPLGYAAIPDGWVLNSQRPNDHYGHGTVDFPRELTPDELKSYQLERVFHPEDKQGLTPEQISQAKRYIATLSEPRLLLKGGSFEEGKHPREPEGTQDEHYKPGEFVPKEESAPPTGSAEALRQMKHGDAHVVGGARISKMQGLWAIQSEGKTRWAKTAEEAALQAEKHSKPEAEELRGEFGFRDVDIADVAPDMLASQVEKTRTALHELADLLGIDARQLGFAGKVGFKIGRLQNTTLGTYSPARRELAVAVERGMGSLAHEWFHAFDDISGFHSNPQRKGDAATKAMAELMGVLKNSGVRQRGQMLDASERPGELPYWGHLPEISARAFEGYLADKLAEQGRDSHHLLDDKVSNHPDLYGNSEERQAANAAFDNLWAAVREDKALLKSLRLLLALDKSAHRPTVPSGQLGFSWDAEQHPREPAGMEHGGEFVKKEEQPSTQTPEATEKVHWDSVRHTLEDELRQQGAKVAESIKEREEFRKNTYEGLYKAESQASRRLWKEKEAGGKASEATQADYDNAHEALRAGLKFIMDRENTPDEKLLEARRAALSQHLAEDPLKLEKGDHVVITTDVPLKGGKVLPAGSHATFRYNEVSDKRGGLGRALIVKEDGEPGSVGVNRDHLERATDGRNPFHMCSRCGGSGEYSYNAMHGTMCYGCGGVGLQISKPPKEKKGKLAKALDGDPMLLLKAKTQPGQLGFGFDEEKHPREPAGSAKGGEFSKKPEPEYKGGAEIAATKEPAKRGLFGGGVMGYKEAVATNLKHMGTAASEWTSLPIEGMVEGDDDGKSKMMPMFDFKSVAGYADAPTLFPQDANTCCELCGHQIKNVYWLKNDTKQWTLKVGSECVTNFMEGKSGAELTKEAKWEINRDLLRQALDARRGIWTRYTVSVHQGYGRMKSEFPWGAKKAAAVYERLFKLTKDMYADKTQASPFRTDDAQVTRWANKNKAELDELLTEAGYLLAEQEAAKPAHEALGGHMASHVPVGTAQAATEAPTPTQEFRMSKSMSLVLTLERSQPIAPR